MSIGSKLILILGLIASASLHADTIQSDSEWVVVLDNPRPERLQGWQRDEYTSGGSYSGALDLKRVARRVANRHDLLVKAEWFIESLNVYCLIAAFKGDEQKTLGDLRASKKVKWVQASNSFESTLMPKTNSLETGLFNPPELRLPTSINGKGAVVTLIDSAVDTTHPDISNNVLENIDFVNQKNNFSNGEAHGTAIASIIFADQESDLGVTGIASGAKLKAYRGCWEANNDSDLSKANCNTLTLARALDAVARSKSDILNLSLSGPKDRLLDTLIEQIIYNGTQVVTAFDPSRSAENRFPSESTIIVKANSLDQQSGHLLSAPGTKVVASPGGRADFMQGHSVAAAYVSGVLALCSQIEAQLQQEICTHQTLQQLQKSNTNTLESLISLLKAKLQS